MSSSSSVGVANVSIVIYLSIAQAPCLTLLIVYRLRICILKRKKELEGTFKMIKFKSFIFQLRKSNSERLSE